MLKKYISLYAVLSLGIMGSVVGQTFNASIENQQFIGTTFYFDVVLTRTATASDFYLGGCQFILTFNNAAFTSPTIALDPDDATYFVLTNSNGTSCGGQYYGKTLPELAGNQIRISIDVPTFTPSQFNSRIAKITDAAGTHRIGRYAITGISNPNATAGLAWRGPLDGNPYSKISVLENIAPFVASEPSGNWAQPDGAPLPVEITDFGTTVKGKSVHLTWATSTESNNAGFDVERRGEKSDWRKLGFINGNGSSAIQHSYAYNDAAVKPGKYIYRLKQIDRDGTFEYSKEVEAIIALAAEDYAISQNYPNPFNPATKFTFAVKNDDKVIVKVFNMLGQEVVSLFDGTAAANTLYEVNFNATGMASGTYFYMLKTSDRHEIKKMILLK